MFGPAKSSLFDEFIINAAKSIHIFQNDNSDNKIPLNMATVRQNKKWHKIIIFIKTNNNNCVVEKLNNHYEDRLGNYNLERKAQYVRIKC